MFTAVDIAESDAGILEQLGTKEKFWVRNQEALFKKGREGTGENWAEVVSAEVAKRLGLPHAAYELAICGPSRGVQTPNFVPAGGRLVLGNELLSPVASYATPERQIARQQHTVRRVHAILRQTLIKPPLGWLCPEGINGAAGVFVGYIMLDALIGNQDRHDKNWGLIVQPPQGGTVSLTLAPTFDHASSLGRNETDNTCINKLKAKHPGYGIEAYSRRAKSQFYLDGGRIKTSQAFLDFVKLESTSAMHWVARLDALTEADIDEVLRLVPADWISVHSREFAAKLMMENRRRILDLSR